MLQVAQKYVLNVTEYNIDVPKTKAVNQQIYFLHFIFKKNM